MSYYTYYYPSKEKIEELRNEVKENEKQYSFFYGDNVFENELLFTTLKGENDEKIVNFRGSFCNIKSSLKIIVEEKRKEHKKWLLNTIDECKEENKYFYFCNIPNCYITIDELVNNTAKNLVILKSVIKHPDFFDDNDKFYELQNRIEEEIEGFIYTLNDCLIMETDEEYEDVRKGEDEDYEYRKELGLIKEDEY